LNTVEVNQQGCNVFGCPLLGSLSSWVGSGSYYCRHHYGRDSSKNQVITDKLRQFGDLFAYLELTKSCTKESMTAYDRVARAMNRADLAPGTVTNLGGKAINEWLQPSYLYWRVQSAITREIREA
jgi:hypothetical protein